MKRLLLILTMFTGLSSEKADWGNPDPVEFELSQTLTRTEPKKTISEWTVLVCLQADNDLSTFAIKNLKDMAKVGSNDKLNIVIQIEQPNKPGLWRYIVKKEKIDLEEHVPQDMRGDCVSDLVQACEWAYKKYPAKKHSLIMWNHGCGALDPLEWGGLSHRGIFFNYSNLTYMNNQQQAEALRQIKNNVLGKKIDVLGMDACLMGGLEVAYQLKNYANYFVASEDIELALGWDYTPCLEPLGINTISPEDFVKNIVYTYGNFYRGKIPWYTLSAVDLQQVDLIRKGLDQVVLDLKEFRNIYGSEIFSSLVKNARNSSLKFNTPCYIDLHSFLKELDRRLSSASLKSASLEEVDPFEMITTDQFFSSEYMVIGRSCEGCDIDLIKNEAVEELPTRSVDNPSIKKLRESLSLSIQLIEQAVLANTYGKMASRAGGISVYFPQYVIDASYPKTDYAKDSLWLKFLMEVL